MGRFLSGAGKAGGSVGTLGGFPILPGQLPLFGEGKCALFFDQGPGVIQKFKAPIAGEYRIRVFAGGGSSIADGQSSSFGAIMSATGGKAPPNGLAGGAGGVGVGGDFRATGGAGGAGWSGAGKYSGGGGGAAGSQLGVGGDGGAASGTGQSGSSTGGGGGGAVGGKRGGDATTAGGYGASAIRAATDTTGGPNIHGGSHQPTVVPFVMPMFAFTGGARFQGTLAGYDGAGGPGQGAGGLGAGRSVGSTSSYIGDNALWGGGGGGGGMSGTNPGWGGFSTFGGGQGGSPITPTALGGAGGGGFVMGVVTLAEGEEVNVVVASAITGANQASTSTGIIIVEF